MGFFKLIYGQIEDIKSIASDKSSIIKKSTINEKYSYNVYFVKNARLYTDTINDTSE